MKTCSRCGKDLKRSVDEFGPIREPLCISCFFESPPITPEERKVQLLEEELEETQNRIAELDDEMNDLKSDCYALEDKIEKLKKPQSLDKKMAAWVGVQ